MEQVEAVVVGAGVVGLATARALSEAGCEVLVLESEGAIGTGTSSRNSEVIHAGIYYPTGSLKARLCVAGRRLLYRYCIDRGVEHRRTGKLIVATSEDQRDRLAAILQQALVNGVEGMTLLDGSEARSLEPALNCIAALHSPETGIIDSHGLMLALQGDAEAGRATVAFHAPVEGGHVGADGIELHVGGEAPLSLRTRILVNAAGLHAWEVASRLEGLPAATVPQRWLAKGNYFALSGTRAPFQRLIYPVPEDGGLGVHLTLDLAGQARFGPDVEWLAAAKHDYAVHADRAEGFYASIRCYWPDLPDGALVPAYSGIRPKLSGPGAPAEDFLVQGPGTHGIPGLVNLFGIESPGLTASLALGDWVRRLVIP